MNTHTMSAALAQAFTSDVRWALVEVLDEAYQLASARYDPELGCNGFTFGTDLYHFAKFRLQGRGEPALAPIPLGETSSELELRLRVSEFNVAVHRVGCSSGEDISACFPSSSGGPARLARLNAVQLELQLGWTGAAPFASNVVVAHLGNPENGLEAVYLAVPFGVAESGKINAWAYTELVWQWDGEGASDYQVADLPQAIPIDEVTVQVRARKSEVEDTGPTT